MNWKALPILFFLVSCEIKEEAQVLTEESNGGKIFPIDKIGACEYIVSNNAYGKLYSHKGDCNNPIHRNICDTLIVHDTLYLERTPEGLKMK